MSAPPPSSPRRHPSRPQPRPHAHARHRRQPHRPLAVPEHPAPAVRAGRRVRSLLARPRRPARAPDRGRPRRGPGSSPASPCPFTAVGITWTLVALTCGAAALATARRRREPWTLACAGLAVLLVLPMTLRAAGWVADAGRCSSQRPCSCAGVTGARTLPGIPAGRDGVAAGVAARPAVVRPLARGSPAPGRHAAPWCVTTLWSLLGLARLRHALRLRRRRRCESWVDSSCPT